MHNGTGAQTITLSSAATALLIRNTSDDDLTFSVNDISITLKSGEQLIGAFNSFSSLVITTDSTYDYQAITQGGTLL
jgi:hypothetical protein